jgi:hypothetical protein
VTDRWKRVGWSETCVEGEPTPQAGDAVSFGADCTLLGALLVAVGTPLYYTLKLPTTWWMGVAYAVLAGMLPFLVPFVVWSCHWGLPVPRQVHRMAGQALLYTIPAHLVVAYVVWTRTHVTLVGVSIMLYSGAMLIAFAGGRFGKCRPTWQLLVLRGGCMLLTPVIIFGLTQMLPRGFDIIHGWAIAMPVVGAGAVGAARSYQREMVLRAAGSDR